MRYGACETFTGSDHAALERWRATSPVAVRASCNHRFCDLGESLYLLDRCWNNRFFCSIHMGNHTAPLVVGQADSTPAGTRLDPGRYLVALGPAATLGVASHTSFADTLRRQLQLPVVNLGRGGSGPGDYVHAMTVGGLTPLLANSAAVLIVLMAGRSSPNSAYGPRVSAMVRADAVARLGSTNPMLAAQLRNESLAAASDEYAAIAAALRANSKGRDSPEIFLIWFSEQCELSSGCRHPAAFPQFFTDGSRARAIAERIGAHLIDGFYGRPHASTPWPLPLDRCMDCPSAALRGHKTCTMDDARREISPEGLAPQDRTAGRVVPWESVQRNATRLGCTQTCAYVLPGCAHSHRVCLVALATARNAVFFPRSPSCSQVLPARCRPRTGGACAHPKRERSNHSA